MKSPIIRRTFSTPQWLAGENLEKIVYNRDVLAR